MDRCLAPSTDERPGLELLLALGDAQRKAANIEASAASFEQAARSARRLGDAELLARAGLGLTASSIIGDAAAERRVALLDEALRSLERSDAEGFTEAPAADNTLTAMVMARLAALLQQTRQHDRSASLGRQAVAMARRLRDAATLAFVLAEPHVAFAAPEHLQERLAVTTEIVRLAEQTGDNETAFLGYSWRLANLLELGDIAAVDAEIATLSRLAQALRQPFARWYTTLVRAMRAMLAGEFATSEQLGQEALAVAQQANLPGAMAPFAGQLLQLRQAQGRLAEVEPLIKEVALQDPNNLTVHIALAHLYSELERAKEARTAFERLAAQDFADLPHDWMRPLALMLLAQTCATLGDERRAALLYHLLLPYADRLLVGGPFLCGGPAARLLGCLASTLSQWEAAEAHFSVAAQLATALGSPPWLAQTQYDHAQLLLARGSANQARAHELLRQTLVTARQLGMLGLAGRAAAAQEVATR